MQNINPYTQSKTLQRRAQRAEHEYLAAIAKHCSHALTLQTCFATQNVCAEDMAKNYDAVRQALHQLRMRSNRALTGNGWQRNARYLPIFVPVIEGTTNTYDPYKTLHLHIAVGNLPERYTHADLYSIYSRCWRQIKYSKPDVVITALQAGNEAGWLHYCAKEQRQGRTDAIDYYNAQIPEHIVAQL